MTIDQTATTPRLRIGARMLVLDADDRVLLLSSHDERDGHRFWPPPALLMLRRRH